MDKLLGGTDGDAVNRGLDCRAGRPENMPDWVKISGLAEWFGVSVSTTRRKLPALYAAGFPQPVLNRWYLPACDDWARNPVAVNGKSTSHLDDPLMEALDGQRQH